jgi:hypothetical protein
VKLKPQDDKFREVKRWKKHISNDTSQAAKKSTKRVPTSTAVKLPPKAVLTRNFFTPVRTTEMNMETTAADNVLPEQETPKNSGRPPPIAMTSTTNFIPLQSNLKRPQRRVRVLKHMKWNPYHNKRNGIVFSHEIVPQEK